MSRLSRALTRFDLAKTELRAAEAELLGAQAEERGALKKAKAGDRLEPEMLGDGVVLLEQSYEQGDEYGLRTIYRGPDLHNARTWWLRYDGHFVALYPEELLLKSFVGTGKYEKLRKAPKNVPPRCRCGAYHHHGANDGLCAY